MKNNNLPAQLEEMQVLRDQLKEGVPITPEIKKSYHSLIVSIHKFYNEKVIPTVLDSFVCREDIDDYNWGLYTILNFFNRNILTTHLRKALTSENCGTRLWALTLLRKSMTSELTNENFEQEFASMLNDPESSVRYEALVSIVLCSSNPSSYIKETLDEDPSDKIKTLVEKVHQDHLEALHYLLNQLVPFSKRIDEMDGKTVNDTDELIQVIAPFQNEKSIPFLLQAYLPYEDDDLGSNKTIEKMLDHYTDEQLLPYLHEALIHGNDGSKAVSILMLGAIQYPNYLKLIHPFVHHENEFIRLKVIEGCSLFDDPSSKPILKEMVNRDVSAVVREEAEIVLEILEDQMSD
ncbi:HEAT repeat domain-containing protein [Shimazuella kribbensis]|uniref:HEAT repeat domain-containing protein n=1 Tax=Shimazuella kribbensis TaxID=139808 RepID=UPI0003FB309D|nr:HEAT repeat domain-containing protein [Shimazuella kribbensis]